MIVIGLSAKMGCGKTTLSEMIRDMAPVEVAERLAFGDVLKEECSKYLGFPTAWCYSQEGKERRFSVALAACIVHNLPETMTVREALQWYGTDFRRAQDPAYWVKAMRKKLMLLKEQHARQSLLVVVDDVRFPDEAQVCLDNGYCFRVEPFPGWKPGPHAGHASETALDGWDKFTEVYHPQHGLDPLKSVAERIVWRAWG